MFSQRFGRLITAMVTPFCEADLSIDNQALEKLIEHLIKNNTTSLLITGTTGENPTLTHAEETQLLRTCKSIIKGRIPIIFGAGSNCTKTCIEASKNAMENGADAIMLVSPYYNKPSQDGMFCHFSEVAKEVDLPIILYNNPGRTSSYIQATTIAKLHEKHKNIQAIKESRSDNCLDTLTQLQIIVPNFEIYSGDDSLIIPVLGLGGVGIVSVASHVVGSQMKILIEKFFSGDFTEAAKDFNKLYPLFRSLFASPSPGPIKYLLSELKICSSKVRLPLTEPPDSIKQSLKEIFSEVARIKL